MAERLIALASGVHPGLAPEAMARTAGEAGYNSVGLWVEPGVNWDRGTTARVRSELEAHGLSVLDVEVIWLRPGAAPDPMHHEIIAVGGELGARNCLIVSSEPDRDSTLRRYEDLCEHAAAAGMRACLEFMGVTEVKDLASARDIVETVDHPAGGLLVDAFHLERVGLAPTDPGAVDPRWLPYVQLCDVPQRGAIADAEAYYEDALDGRLAPGEGALPLREFLGCFPADLPISLEVRSRFYRETYPDPVERARRILASTREFFAAGA
jgi:sugar phosphate isomerase/epimerase